MVFCTVLATICSYQKMRSHTCILIHLYSSLHLGLYTIYAPVPLCLILLYLLFKNAYLDIFQSFIYNFKPSYNFTCMLPLVSTTGVRSVMVRNSDGCQVEDTRQPLLVTLQYSNLPFMPAKTITGRVVGAFSVLLSDGNIPKLCDINLSLERIL